MLSSRCAVAETDATAGWLDLKSVLNLPRSSGDQEGLDPRESAGDPSSTTATVELAKVRGLPDLSLATATERRLKCSSKRADSTRLRIV